MIENSYELYRLLEKQELLKDKPAMWWPNYGDFEVVIGAILTQNAQWSRVEVSLENLRKLNALDLETFSKLSIERLEELISPSGLFKSKAKYLHTLAHSIKEGFGSFDNFCLKVDRSWLLRQKGIGPETADSILCYACRRDFMVVDAYTARLLSGLGYSFESYDALQDWCVKGLYSKFKEDKLFSVYALFHGMIVEFVKTNSTGKKINIKGLI